MNTQTPEEIKNKPFFYKPFFIEPKANLFAERAIRFDELAQAEHSGWHDYLTLMATVCRAQDDVLNRLLPETPLPDITGQTHLPPSDGSYLPKQLPQYMHALSQNLQDKVNETIANILNELDTLADHELTDMAQRVLRDEVPEQEQIFRIWLHAALQTIWTAWATQLRDEDVPSVEERSVCPCCGGDAVAGMVLNGGDWHGLRYLHCGVCNSRWNALRAKCTFCGDQSAISLEHIDDQSAPPVFKGARAEHCGKCGHYRKLFLLPEQQYADPIADDLASLAVDILMAEENSLRGGQNPFLLR